MFYLYESITCETKAVQGEVFCGVPKVSMNTWHTSRISSVLSYVFDSYEYNTWNTPNTDDLEKGGSGAPGEGAIRGLSGDTRHSMRAVEAVPLIKNLEIYQ